VQVPVIELAQSDNALQTLTLVLVLVLQKLRRIQILRSSDSTVAFAQGERPFFRIDNQNVLNIFVLILICTKPKKYIFEEVCL